MAEVKLKITADGSGASAALGSVESACSKLRQQAWEMAKAFAPVALAAGAFTQLASSAASAVPETQRLGLETEKLQKTTGMTAESASELIAVADQVGVSFGVLESVVVQISKKMGGLKGIEDMVADASGAMVDVFEKFNIAVKNTDGTLKNFTDVFAQIREKIQSASTETEKMAIATQFYRGNAAELMPLLNMSSAQYKEIAEDAKKYGIILTQDNVNAVRQYTMAHRDLDDAFMGLKLSIGTALMPVLKDMADSLASAVKGVRDFAKENQRLLTLPFDVLKGVKENFTEIALAMSVTAVMFYSSSIAKLIQTFSSLRYALALTQRQAMALNAGIYGMAAVLGYEMGRLIDTFVYKLKHIRGGKLGYSDISGMNMVKEIQEGIAEEQERLNKRAERYNKMLAELGFIGPNAMKEFNAAVSAGAVVFDEFEGKWKKKSETFKNSFAMTKEQIEALTKTLGEFSKTVESVGMEKLKLSEEGFEKGLKDEAQKFTGENLAKGFKEQTFSISQGRMELGKYLNEIDSVYNKQISGQKKIKEILENIHAPFKDIDNQSIKIIETEKKQIEARLGAYKAYYEHLSSLHSAAVEEQKKKTEELAQFEKAMQQQRLGHEDLVLSLEQRLMTDKEKYFSQQADLEKKYKLAMGMTGQGKIEMLEAWKQAAASSAIEVKEGDNVIISSKTAVETALKQVNEAQKEIKKEQEKIIELKKQEQDSVKKWADTLKSAMDEAKKEMDEYQQKIIALGEEMQSLNLVIEHSQALGAIEDIKSLLASIDTVTTKTIVIDTVYTGASGGAATGRVIFPDGSSIPREISEESFTTPVDDSYAIGTRYVPATGIYKLHQGEEVRTRNEAGREAAAPNITVNMPEISVYGNTDNPEELARKIVKPIRDELRRLEYLH